MNDAPCKSDRLRDTYTIACALARMKLDADDQPRIAPCRRTSGPERILGALTGRPAMKNLQQRQA